MNRPRLLATMLGLLTLSAPLYSQAIRTNPGFAAQSLARNDDGSTGLIQLGFPINFFGRLRTAAYVNNNGNITFDSALADFTPFGLTGVHREIIAAFFADVDTRSTLSNLVTYGQDTVNGHKAFGVNYLNVGYYDQHADKLNSFQLVLIDRSDTGSGNFDIEFNYGSIQWETGDASGGVGGRGGVSASVGWSNGSGQPDTSYQLPGSLVNGAFLDGGAHALARNSVNTKAATGRYQFRARDGQISPGVVITTGCPLPNASQGKPYSFQLQSAGSSTPMRFSLIPDPVAPLPGLSLSSSGLITGTPTASGEYAFTLKGTATDEDGDVTVTARCGITVDPAQLRISSACPLPPATVGLNYAYNFTVADGPGPYVWRFTDDLIAPGLTLAANGQLRGTPSRAGTYNMSVQVSSTSDPDVQPATRICPLTVSTSPSSLTAACSLPNGVVGVNYTAQLGAAGGVAPYRFAVLGRLPDGLAATADGTISGIPGSVSTNSFTAQVTDARGQQTTQDCSLTVQRPALTVTTACPLPSGQTGMPYNAALAVSGGVAPYQWSATGSLPRGLSLSKTGVLSGTPTDVGAASFRLQVVDSQGQPASQACNLSILPGSLFIYSGCPASQARLGESYTSDLIAGNGAAPYFWSSEGNLPAGLQVTSGSVARLAGIPSSTGTYNYSLQVQDRSGKKASLDCQIQVAAQSRPEVTTMCPLPNAQLGQPYTAQVEAAGGTGSISFTAVGPLPAGLSLSGSGQLSGTPQAAGNYPFVLQVADQLHQASTKNCSLAVNRPPLPGLQISAVNSSYPAASAGPRIQVQLNDVYPTAVRGRLRLQVAANTGNSLPDANQTDPRVKFANGQPAVTFTIPPGSRSYAIQVPSTGTVASTATITMSDVTAGDDPLLLVPPAQTFGVSRSVPVLTDACYATTANGGATLNVTGYSTTRSLQTANLSFTGSKQSVNIQNVSDAYFTDPDSVRFGGSFTLSFPFTPPASLSSFTVSLTNSEGSSTNRTVSRCQQ